MGGKEIPKSNYQVFLIHGTEEQSGYGLFQRFILKYISKRYGKNNYFANTKDVIPEILPAPKENGAKRRIMSALAKATGKELEDYQHDDPQFLTKLVDSCESKSQNFKDAKDKKCIALMLQVYSHNWDQNENYVNALQWLTKELYPLSQFDKEPPDFIFFVNVIYNNLEKPKGFFNKIFGSADPFEKIRKQINSIPTLSPIASALPELSPVEKNDIISWLDIVKLDKDDKAIILKKEFDDQDKLPMQEVENTLEKIIHLYNDGKLKDWVGKEKSKS